MRMHNNNVKTVWIICTLIMFLYSGIVNASVDENCLTPSNNQYLELRAVKVEEIQGKNKQVTMELWGYELEFTRNCCEILI